MKTGRQIKNALLFVICSFALIGCTNNGGGETTLPPTTEGGENKPSEENPNSKVTNIFFSELHVGTSVNDAILEIGTTSEKPVSLRGYKVNFYGSKNLAYSYTFNDETISKDKLVLFVNKEATYSNITSTIIKLDNNYVCGRYYCEIVDEKGKYIDKIGLEGFNLEYVKNGSLVRLAEYQKSTHTYDELHFVKVRGGVTDYLGNLKSPVTLNELLEGPKLEEKIYGDLPFSENKTPKGGYTEVSIASLGDGDTTFFNYSDSSGCPGKHSTRYLLIDTPEVDHGPNSHIKEEPWGTTAKKFNNDILRNAKSIMVQSNLGYSLNETYGRYLGYVWYTNDESKAIDTYRLLNFEITKAGLCEFSRYDSYETMHSKDVCYFNYLEYVNEIARRNKIKIHGEKDPNFNY